MKPADERRRTGTASGGRRAAPPRNRRPPGGDDPLLLPFPGKERAAIDIRAPRSSEAAGQRPFSPAAGARRTAAPREYACALATALPLQALLRSEPDLAGRPVAVVTGEGTRAVLAHASRAARTLGTAPGMTPAQARSVAPSVLLRTVAPPVVAAARQALLDAASAFSPEIEPRDPDAVVLDIRGTRGRYPTPQALGCALEAACARAGLRVRVGIARGPRLARIAARARPGVTVLPPGEEAGGMADLPLHALDPSPELADTLARLGLRTVGDLARVDSHGLGIRLGPEGMDRHRLARGLDESVITPLPPSESFEEAVELEWTLDRVEPLLFLLSSALDRLASRLEARGMAPAALRLDLVLDPEGVHAVPVSPPAPTTDLRSLLALVRLSLEADPPPGPVRGFVLRAEGGRVAGGQGHLFGPPVPPPSRLALLVGRLCALAGPAGVGAPVVLDDAGTDPASLAPFAPRALPEARPPLSPLPGGAGPAAHPLALRRFRPPREVAVRVREGRPAEVRGEGPSGIVARAAGPWYAEVRWWTEAPEAGACWDVEIPGRGLFRLWQDLRSGRWFLDGQYD